MSKTTNRDRREIELDAQLDVARAGGLGAGFIRNGLLGRHVLGAKKRSQAEDRERNHGGDTEHEEHGEIGGKHRGRTPRSADADPSWCA